MDKEQADRWIHTIFHRADVPEPEMGMGRWNQSAHSVLTTRRAVRTLCFCIDSVDLYIYVFVNRGNLPAPPTDLSEASRRAQRGSWSYDSTEKDFVFRWEFNSFFNGYICKGDYSEYRRTNVNEMIVETKNVFQLVDLGAKPKTNGSTTMELVISSFLMDRPGAEVSKLVCKWTGRNQSFYTERKLVCRAENGHLAVINSAEEDARMKKWLRDLVGRSYGWLGISFYKTATTTANDVKWLDGTKINDTRINHWVDSDVTSYIK